MLCDHLKGWDREGGRETQEGGDMRIYVYVSLEYMCKCFIWGLIPRNSSRGLKSWETKKRKTNPQVCCLGHYYRYQGLEPTGVTLKSHESCASGEAWKRDGFPLTPVPSQSKILQK